MMDMRAALGRGGVVMMDMRAALVLHLGPAGVPPRLVAFTDQGIEVHSDDTTGKPAVVMHAHGTNGETVNVVLAPDVAQLLGQQLELTAMQVDPSLIDMRGVTS